MAKYTTEVRSICESLSGLKESVGYASVDEVIANSYDKIFDAFPIFDEAYRETLCSKILKHYYTREIGAESFGLWKLQLNRKMEEIMPYYNQLYESERLTIDPLKNYKGGSNRTLDKLSNTNGTEQTSNTGGTTGTVDHLRTGGYTDTNNGTIGRTKTGSKANVTTGSESNVRSGNMDNENTKEGYTTDTRKVLNGNVSTSFVDLFTDTPQGNINNMGDGYHLPDGTPTDVPIVGTDTAYLTTAEKTNQTVRDTQEIENKRAFSDDYKDNTKTTYNNVTDTKTYNNLTNTETYNSIKDDETHGDTTSRVYNRDDMLDTYNTQRTNTGSGTKQVATTGKDTESITDGGYRGITESEMLALYRKTFLNIDLDIIKELKSLFMLVW